MQEDKRWADLLAKERRLADHEWELYQKLGQAKAQEEDVLCQLDSMGTWFHDLSYDLKEADITVRQQIVSQIFLIEADN